MQSKRARGWYITYLIIHILYLATYVSMYFIPEIHEAQAPFLLLGLVLMVGFIFFRSFTDHSKMVTMSAVVVVISLVFLIIINMTGDTENFFQYPIIHFISHLFFALSFFIFSIGLYLEYSGLTKNQRIKKAFFNDIEAVLFEYNQASRSVYIELSERFRKLYQISNTVFTVTIDAFRHWVLPDDSRWIESMEKRTEKLEDNTVIHLSFGESGEYVAINIYGSYVFGSRIVYFGFDHTTIETLEQFVISESAYRDKLLDNMMLGFAEHEMIYDEAGNPVDYRYLYGNKAFQQMTHWSPESYLNKRVSEVYPLIKDERIQRYQELLNGKEVVEFDSLLEPQGEWFKVRAYKTGDNRFASIFLNVTDMKRANQELQYLATHNRLSGLLNNFGLYQEIEKHSLDDRAICYYVSIANFEEIESFYGPRFADELIRSVTKEFQRYVDDKDIVANTKYSHFILILLNPSPDKIEKTREHALQSIFRKHMILDTELYVTQNIGVAVLHEDAENLDELITAAHVASYEAEKREHRELVRFQWAYSDQIHQNMTMAGKLQSAIENRVIDVVFQKIFNTKTNRFEYVEALARWNDPSMGNIPPALFFELAIKASLIDSLDEYLIEQTLEKYGRLVNTHFEGAILNLNLSPTVLYRDDVEKLVCTNTNKNQLKPHQICIEVSENTFVRDTEQCIRIISQLKDRGFLIAIDDFGSKYSSIGILDLIPYDILKLDGVFSGRIANDTTRLLVKTLAEVCETEGKILVIERIETEQEAKQFIELGCVVHQGYYYHFPERFGD